MPRYLHPSGKFWFVEGSATMIDERWGEGAKSSSRVHRFETEPAMRAKLATMIAARVAGGYVPDDAPVTVAAQLHDLRRFELAHGVVQVELSGTMVTHPDPANPGAMTITRHASAREARLQFNEVVAILARRSAGVTEIEADEVEPEAARIATNPELEALCLASREAPGPWVVYADWLMANGDPRGELAALVAAGRGDVAERLLVQHRPLLFGDDELAAAVELHWEHGFVRGATIKRDTISSDETPALDALTRDFLASPIARFVDTLRFGLAGFSGANDWRPTLDAVIASAQGPRIRELRFDAYSYEDSELSWVPFGDFSTAWPGLASLEVLHIKSGEGGTLGAIALPKLRTFIRESGGLGAGEIASICAAAWPSLERLVIWFGREVHGAEGTLDGIRAILEARGLPAVRHLGLVNCELSDTLIPALAGSTILPQLRTLDLSKGVMAAVAAARLVEHAAAFRHLHAIELGENLLDDDELAAIRKVLPQVASGTQRSYERPYDDDDAEDIEEREAGRYAAVGE